MFGSIGGPEVILIFVVALIVFGPKRLPEIGRRIGAAVRELRRATGEFRTSVEREIGIDPVTGLETVRKARRDVLSTVSDPIREAARSTLEQVQEARREVLGPIEEAAKEAAPPPRVPSGAQELPASAAPEPAKPQPEGGGSTPAGSGTARGGGTDPGREGDGGE